MAVKPLNLCGRKFGKLEVLSLTGQVVSKSGQSRRFWLCRCECGKETKVVTHALTGGNTQSCGCMKGLGNYGRTATHGMWATPVYRTWRGMKQRCHDKNATGYERYGGKGIKVCDRWRNSFENFFADMGDKPSHLYSIDRIDSAGDYEPRNCRWLLKYLQNRNKRNNVLTWQSAAKIKELRALGFKYAEIVEQVGASYGLVKSVCDGRIWK